MGIQYFGLLLSVLIRWYAYKPFSFHETVTFINTSSRFKCGVKVKGDLHMKRLVNLGKATVERG